MRWKLQGLERGSVSYMVSSLVEGLSRPVIVLADTPRYAEQLHAELKTFRGESAELPFLDRRVHLFAAREAPPLEMVSPAPETEAARSAALYQLLQMAAPIIVTSPAAVACRTLPPAALVEESVYLVVGEELDFSGLVDRLEAAGYRSAGAVEEPGEKAVRGGLIDVWPPGYDYPCRCQFDGDTVESIRPFDPADQRSFASLEEMVVLPALPFPLERLAEPEVRRRVGRRCEELGLPTAERRQLDDCLAAGERFPGVELMVPYVFDASNWLGDFLGEDVLTVVIDAPAVEKALDRHGDDIEAAEQAAGDAGTFHFEAASAYAERGNIESLIARRPGIELDFTEALDSTGEPGHRAWRVDVRANTALAAARAKLKAQRGSEGFHPVVDQIRAIRKNCGRLAVVASDPTQLHRLEHLLELNGAGDVRRAESLPAALSGTPDCIWMVEGRLDEGFQLPADDVAFVTDHDIFGERRRSTRRRRVSQSRAMNMLGQLANGDAVVHVDHGIGIYKGLKHMLAGGTEGDFIHLEYLGGDRYYLPVDRINLIERYVGSGGGPPKLDRLGSAAWVRTKARAKESALEIAQELLELEAFRMTNERRPYARQDGDYEEFEAHFPFEETPGQQSAIDDMVADMLRPKSMDRLVCGDVGYGKTEVAMRAAYLAALGGKQAAFLVPTTILARQHFETLKRRFDGYPVQVAMLSRFNSREENAAAVKGLAEGGVDIVVGTHRLLQKDVAFSRLGLLIVDEEHRFGVQAKERIKHLRREVDVLTLTATPIPRTLQLALGGVRDLSLIETAPVDRLSIRTYVARHDPGLIKQAISRELDRGGQVFFVHNRVSSIGAMARTVQELVPGARVAAAHGQMKETELEKVMIAFLEGDTDVLVCTTIIESGLDIPNANTMIINRADALGLAQLYQIRGRVGRSHRRAYAYLLVPNEGLITDTARRRLAVLQQLDDLGGGFRLAAHDLEIRGAGNLIGKKQSGNMAAVGFELFVRMLEEATKEVRGQAVAPVVEPEIELGAHAFVPDDYITDVGERLLVYKRLANVTDAGETSEIAEELADRFGPLPPQVEDFVKIMALRPVLKRLAVEQLKWNGRLVSVKFHEDSPVDSGELVELATRVSDTYRLRPEGLFTMDTGNDSWDTMIDRVDGLLNGLAPRSAEDPKAGIGSDEGASTHRPCE